MWKVSKEFFSGLLATLNIRETPNSPRKSTVVAENHPVLVLSDRQIELIRLSWTDDFGQMYELGATIFDHLVACQPEIEKVFASAYKSTQVCRKDLHYFFLQFIQLLTVAVSNLRSPQSVLDPLLLQVGLLHARQVQNGFKPEYFDGFALATASAMREYLMAKNEGNVSEAQINETSQAWVPLCDYMVTKMKIGFYRGTDKLH